MPRLPSPMLRHRLTPSRPYNARARRGRLLPPHLPRGPLPNACCHRPSARRLYLHLRAEKPGRARDIQESYRTLSNRPPMQRYVTTHATPTSEYCTNRPGVGLDRTGCARRGVLSAFCYLIRPVTSAYRYWMWMAAPPWSASVAHHIAPADP